MVVVFLTVHLTLTTTSAGDPRGSTREPGWFEFQPGKNRFDTNSAIDLRYLNEKFAGENGFIAVQNGRFVHSANGEVVRFWAVNGPPENLKGEELKSCARLLARYGVNMVRVHGGLFDRDGEVDMAKINRSLEVVEAMKAEGIYTHFSIYFPLWLTPKKELPWLRGYDGTKHPFAALFFNPEFQAQYRKWWTALLTTPNRATGKRLVDEPAVASLEMLNEDSFFFWTFSIDNLPDEQGRMLEKMFGDWLARRYGSIDAGLAKWKGPSAKRDVPAEGRVSFRPLWNMFNEKTARDQDTARFLLEVQTSFYGETRAFLRRLGFRGPITASNWATASPTVFGPLEKLSYLEGDFVDRHGYFSCNHKGDNAAWSIRDAHTYADRSALRFDPEEPGKPKQFVHPAMDPHYAGKPSMISETTWTRPNRYRSEAPLYFAAYGALQGTDAIVHFALDGADWVVKPRFFMQPWTLMSPAMMGQFPAAALIFRQGLVAQGEVLAKVKLNKEDLLQLRGTPLPQDAALDELRMQDVPAGTDVRPGQRLDPLLHYAGKTEVNFTTEPSGVTAVNPRPYIDHGRQTVSSTTGELLLDYGQGVLRMNAPRAQGVSGNLRLAGKIELKDLTISSELELGHIAVVPLDLQPLATSSRIFVQVMSEEKASGFETEAVSSGVKRIKDIGKDPWLVRELAGTIRFKRSDAARLKVTALDSSGHPSGPAGAADEIRLRSDAIYYLVEKI